ncbi:MAG: hypothetical protein MUO76_03375 [Anaerolineaceae bacterium]|nr:hypothetical protein [Anaerolineaceae bacterium]
MHPGMYHDNFGFGHFWGFGWIVCLFIIVAFVIGVVLLVTWLVRRKGSQAERIHAEHGTSPRSAREVLQVRYASGEVTRDEYLDILKDLDE